jgi:hypothetical protein
MVFLGDHSHLVLVDDQGNRVGVGQYGMAEDFNCAHAMSACGRKKGGIETPDRYLLLPKDSHSYKKTDLIVSRQEFACLMDQVKKDKADPNLSVSLGKSNCTGYVKGLLEKIGIELPTKMSFAEALVRKYAPLSLVKRGDAWWNSVKGEVPDWCKKAIYFFPPIYLVTMGMSLLVRLGSFHNFRKEAPDYGFDDVFLKPWNFWGNHPMALRLWQRKVPEQMDAGTLRKEMGKYA